MHLNLVNRRMMRIPVKPCDGRFGDDLQEALTRNRNREQWGVHVCQLCGASVGAVQLHGEWIPEQHWPSVTYPARNAAAKKPNPSAAADEDAVTGDLIAR